MIHWDSRAELFDQYFGERYWNGTMYRRSFEDGLILPHKLLEVGIRRIFGDFELDYAKEMDIRLITMAELKQMNVEGFRDELQRLFGDIKVYVSFDIDFVDPAFAPGTGGPERGGATSFETIRLVRCLRGLNIVGLDMVEVCPPLDLGNMTSLLASVIMFELLCILP